MLTVITSKIRIIFRSTSLQCLHSINGLLIVHAARGVSIDALQEVVLAAYLGLQPIYSISGYASPEPTHIHTYTFYLSLSLSAFV